MESGFVHNSNEDVLDPQYMGFLDNLRGDETSYALEIEVHNGLAVRLKYEFENELSKGSQTRALQNLGVLEANSGIENRAKVPRDSDDVSGRERDTNMGTLRAFLQEGPVDRKKKTCLNEDIIGTELSMRNGLIKTRVMVPQTSNDDAPMRKGQRNTKCLKASLQKDLANKKVRSCQKMGIAEGESIRWNGRAEKEVEIPRNSNDASTGRELVLWTPPQTEPANRKRKVHQNEENVERVLLARNDVTEKAVQNRRNSHGVSWEKSNKSLKSWKISSQGKSAKREKKAFQKKEKLENVLVLWDSKMGKVVEIPRNTDDVSKGRKMVSKGLLQTEPAIRKRKAHPQKKIVESGLIVNNDVMKKQIGIRQNSKDISRGKRHRNAIPFEASLQRELTNGEKMSLLTRNPETKNANPLCGDNKGCLSKMVGQFVPQSNAHDSRHSNRRRLEDSDESYVALVSRAYNTRPYITNDKKTERHAKNNGDGSSEVEIFGMEDLPCYAEERPSLTNGICYTDDEMDMDSQESPRIPGRTYNKPKNVKSSDTSSQNGPTNGKRKNLLTKKNPEMRSANPLCNTRKLDDPDESYVALVSQTYNTDAHVTNDNRTENSANGDGDSLSEVEILEIEDLSRYGEKNPFVISCTYDEEDMVSQESPQAPRVTRFNPFREELIALLRKPFDSNEYSRLLTKAAYRKPKQIVRICHDGKKRVFDTVSKSLLNQFSDLVEKIDAVRSDRCRVLNLLRGFFYYLQNQSVQGSFLPWLDSSCLMVLPEAK